MKTKTLLLLASVAVYAAGVWAAPVPPRRDASDWPQWQGPDRTNLSREKGLLKSWRGGQPRRVWTFDQTGIGYSGPAVVGNRLYIQGSDGDTEVLLALDVATGKKVWSARVGPLFRNGYGDGPRGTPTVDGDRVYAIGGQGNLLCVKAADGEQVWEKGLKTDLGGQMMSGWGYTESPLVDGDHVICTPGGPKGTLAALDKKTGDVVWRSTDFRDKAGYSSPVVSTACGVRHYVVMTGESLAGISPRDGSLLWRFAHRSGVAAIPTPICHDDYVYATSGYGAGCVLVKLSRDGDKLQAEEVYANQNMSNHHGGVVLVDGYLYGYAESKGWVCQDFKTGEIVWQDRARLGKGSLTYADGRLYCYAEADGTVALVEASPKGWKEDGRFRVPNTSRLPIARQGPRGKFWAHPVVANGHLFLRHQEQVFCYDIKGR